MDQEQQYQQFMDQRVDTVFTRLSSIKGAALMRVVSASPYLRQLPDQERAREKARAIIMNPEKYAKNASTEEIRAALAENPRMGQLQWQLWNRDLTEQAIRARYRSAAMQEILQREATGVINLEKIWQLLRQDRPFQIISFSCPGIIPGEKTISTMMYDSKVPDMIVNVRTLAGFLRRFSQLLLLRDGSPGMSFTTLFDDEEPFDIWGWERSKQNTRNMTKLLDKTSQKLPLLLESRDIVLSKDGFTCTGISTDPLYRAALAQVSAIVAQTGNPVIRALIDAEIATYRWLAQEYGIFIPNAQRTGRKSAISYMAQGLYMEWRYPNAVYMQLETPVRLRNLLYQVFRTDLLPIFQPVALGEEPDFNSILGDIVIENVQQRNLASQIIRPQEIDN